MKILTLNFLTCAIRTCKTSPASFPLHVRDAELEQTDLEYNPLFLRNILPRLEWAALGQVAEELGLPVPRDPTSTSTATGGAEASAGLGAGEAEGGEVLRPVDPAEVAQEVAEEDLKRLHTLLLETQIQTGKLVCGNCGHEYAIREGIANFLLPAHLV